MKNHLKRKWNFIVVAALLLTLLTFSPWVLNASSEPRLFSMPYTLWTSIITTVLMVIITLWGGEVFKKMKGK